MFDLDGVQLIALARHAGARALPVGPGDRPAPHFCVGAVENPGAPPLEYRVRRAAKKALAGARFLQLQMSYRTELAGAVRARPQSTPG